MNVDCFTVRSVAADLLTSFHALFFFFGVTITVFPVNLYLFFFFLRCAVVVLRACALPFLSFPCFFFVFIYFRSTSCGGSEYFFFFFE